MKAHFRRLLCPHALQAGCRPTENKGIAFSSPAYTEDRKKMKASKEKAVWGVRKSRSLYDILYTI
jgi:hypothetical protein